MTDATETSNNPPSAGVVQSWGASLAAWVCEDCDWSFLVPEAVALERCPHCVGVDKKFAPSILLYEYLKGLGYLASIKEEIEKRKDGCIYIAKRDFSCAVENCDFDEAVKQAKEILEIKADNISELKGQIACGGVVRGVAQLEQRPHRGQRRPPRL